MSQAIVIYNPASICSVIGAAFIVNHHKRVFNEGDDQLPMKAYPAGHKVPYDATVNIWVGVEPSVIRIKKMAGKHIGYFDDTMPRNKKLYEEMNVCSSNDADLGEEWLEAFQMLPNSVFKTILEHNISDTKNDTDGEFKGMPQWYLAKIAAEFEYGHKLTLEDQALVWINYHNSLKYLNGLNGLSDVCEFVRSTSMPANVIDNYLNTLRETKQYITMTFETSILSINGVGKPIPLMNVEQTQAPFILRVLSQSYDYAVTYVQRQGVEIYATFSRLAGFDDVVLKSVDRSNHHAQSMMAYQL